MRAIAVLSIVAFLTQSATAQPLSPGKPAGTKEAASMGSTVGFLVILGMTSALAVAVAGMMGNSSTGTGK